MASRLVIVASHPIQHFAPFYRALSQEAELKLLVMFASRMGVVPYFDRGMNTTISWTMDLLGGYDHVFLAEADRITSSAPLEVRNPSVVVELERASPDAVLIYGYNQVTSLLTLAWCRLRGVPALMISDSELSTRRHPIISALKRAIVPIILRQFRGFLTVGDQNEDSYRHFGVDPAQLFRSPFTIDEDRYLQARSTRAALSRSLRDELGIRNDTFVVLTVGKLTERKRAMDIVDAARIVARRYGNANFLFLAAGNGPLMEDMRHAITRENLPVRLLGFVNVDRLPGAYAAADAILHPSQRDPHPLVMSEAACIGLPLLISDRVGAAGPTDIARPGLNADVFPCGDIERIVDTVTRLASDKERQARMSEASIRCFNELNMDRSVQGVLEAMRSLKVDRDRCHARRNAP